ncbi:MAG: hypothetical protein HKN91_14395 [Acidimicrobiia bacterium]|nr:hypothetical protein [Acidimicrobiia bacterium]
MDVPEYSAASDAVVEAFVAAYPDYLARRLHELGIEADIADAARQGSEWLEGELGQWGRSEVAAQRRGPLQIFQTAFAFPTAALQAAGVAPVARDPGAVSALPGDEYALAPASSREIGEEAWRAHVAWGVAKAKTVAAVVPAASPQATVSIAVVTMNQADRASVHLVAQGRGVAAHHWRNPGAIASGLALEVPRWAVVDAGHAAADDAVRTLAEAGAKVAVYMETPDDIAMARWMALGAATVLPRQKLVAVLESWLPLQA